MAAESFVVFTEHWSGMALLSREQRGDLLEALMALHGACEMPELDQATAIVLAMIRPRMEANRKKYEETVAKRKANGALGGRPSKKQTAQEKTLTLQEQPQGSENNLKDSEETIRFSEKPNGSAKNPVYGSDPDYVNTTYSDPPLPPLREPDADASAVSASGDELVELVGESPADEPEQVELSPEHPKRKRTDYRRKDFEEWKTEYGVKVDDERLWKVWKKQIHKIPEQAVLMAALDRYKQSKRWQDGYRKDPDNYLRGCCWNDDFTPAQPPRRYYGPDANGRTPYVNEAEQDFSNVPRNAAGGVDWAQVMGGAK